MPATDLGVRLGSRLRTRREAIGWSQAQLAEAAGVTPNYVGVIERGEKLPMLDTLEAFASALGASLGALLSEEQPDQWADEVAAIARAIPETHRRIVLGMLRAAAVGSRSTVNAGHGQVTKGKRAASGRRKGNRK